MDYSAIGQYTLSSVVRQFWGRAARNVLQEAILAGRFYLRGLLPGCPQHIVALTLGSAQTPSGVVSSKVRHLHRDLSEHPALQNCAK